MFFIVSMAMGFILIKWKRTQIANYWIRVCKKNQPHSMTWPTRQNRIWTCLTPPPPKNLKSQSIMNDIDFRICQKFWVVVKRLTNLQSLKKRQTEWLLTMVTLFIPAKLTFARLDFMNPLYSTVLLRISS